MKLHFPLYLGLRNLFGKNGRLSSHLKGAIIGMALSLIPLIVVLEVADGMIEGITRRYLELGTYHLQITLPREYSMKEYQFFAEEVEKIGSVQHVIIERQGMGLLYSETARSGVTIRAVPDSLYEDDENFRKYVSLVSGSFNLKQSESIILGNGVAELLGAGVGDKVKLLTTISSARTKKRYIPKISHFTVTGIFSSGYQELDKLWIYIPLNTGERILSLSNSSQFMGIKLLDPFDNLDKQIALLQSFIPAEAGINTWYQLEKANYKSFQTTKALLLFIMALIVMVASINISSSLIMVVMEKTREIGILKAMGAAPRNIRLSFLFTGCFTGLAGTLIGLALGLLIAVNINELIIGIEYLVNHVVNLVEFMFRLEAVHPVEIFNTAFYLEEIPIRIGLRELFAVSVLTLLLSASASYFPARSAGGIKPLEIFRKY